ncbi:MAG: Holliday junction resolvase RuvX [Pseudomonadales bacterium]|nr:Holliday junction resolvase RuvX [Pseudomonadales bacterium]
MLDKPKQIPKTVLGFDYGTTKIGIAVGQSFTGTANPLTIIKAKNGIPNWQTIEQLANEWEPDAFIVGWPINMDGTESEMSVRARKFANRLNGRFHRPSFLMDERLSSFEAAQILGPEAVAKGPIDSMAAALIVESWYASF